MRNGLINPSRDAILDLPAFMSLKKALVLLFREPKEPLNPAPVPERPVVVLQPELPEGPRVPRAPSRRTPVVRADLEHPQKRSASTELLDHWTTSPSSRGAPPYRHLSRPTHRPPGRSPSPRSRPRPPRRASSPSAVWSTRPTRARAQSSTEAWDGFLPQRSSIISAISQDDGPAM